MFQAIAKILSFLILISNNKLKFYSVPRTGENLIIFTSESLVLSKHSQLEDGNLFLLVLHPYMGTRVLVVTFLTNLLKGDLAITFCSWRTKTRIVP